MWKYVFTLFCCAPVGQKKLVQEVMHICVRWQSVSFMLRPRVAGATRTLAVRNTFQHLHLLVSSLDSELDRVVWAVLHLFASRCGQLNRRNHLANVKSLHLYLLKKTGNWSTRLVFTKIVASEKIINLPKFSFIFYRRHGAQIWLLAILEPFFSQVFFDFLSAAWCA